MKPRITLNTYRQIEYNSKKYGKWIVSSFDLFWKTNADKVKEYCKGDE